jgi:hypothetical protein
LAAISQLAQLYAVDGIDMKIAGLRKLNPADISVPASKSLADACVSALDEALAQDRYDLAASAQRAAEAAARRSQQPALLKQVQGRDQEIKEAAAEYEKSQEATVRLKEKPEDATALLALGKFLCFRKGDWEKGLPLLAVGSDEALKALAQKDLAQPADAAAKADIAAGWWTAAESNAGSVKLRLMLRAAGWYRKARPGLNGAALQTADQRLLEAEQAQLPPGPGEIRRLFGHSGPVYAVAFSPDGRKALTGGADGTFRGWDIKTGKELFALKTARPSEVRAVAWSNQGKYAATAGADAAVTAWNLESRQAVHVDGSRVVDRVHALAFTPDDRILVVRSTSDYTHLIQFISVRGLQPFGPYMPKSRPSSGAVATDGAIFVLGRRDGTVDLYTLSDRRLSKTLKPGHANDVIGLALSRSGQLALSAGADRTVRVCDTIKDRCLFVLKGHTERITGVALSGDGRVGVTASEDKTVRVWDAKAGRELRRLVGHAGAVHGVSLSRDGRYVLSAGADGTVRLWDCTK